LSGAACANDSSLESERSSDWQADNHDIGLNQWMRANDPQVIQAVSGRDLAEHYGSAKRQLLQLSSPTISSTDQT
jgi:hypothetical protein